LQVRILPVALKEISMPTKSPPAVDVGQIAAFADVHVVADNWVGALQHALMHFDAPAEEYITTSDGPGHQLTFTVECSALGVVALGKGTSKKIARREAAKDWIKHSTKYVRKVSAKS
jgi:dsRNA-specific ribonuclease